MTEQSPAAVLNWRDLSSEDVYHIAHLENETRDVFAATLVKIPFEDEAFTSPEAAKAQKIVTNFESFAEKWLENQATLRGMIVEGTLATSGSRKAINWIKKLRNETGLTQVQFAEATGLTQPTLSKYETDRLVPSADTVDRLIAFRDGLVPS